MHSTPRSRVARVARGVIAFAFALALLYVMDGSRQPTTGSGWRVLAYQRGLGHMNTVTAIADQPSLEAAYDLLHLASPPAVDFAGTEVFLFSGVGSIGCPERFEGLEFDGASRTVSASFARRLMFDCDASRVPNSFVIAVDRSRLPQTPYRVQVANPPPVGVAGAWIVVGP